MKKIVAFLMMCSIIMSTACNKELDNTKQCNETITAYYTEVEYLPGFYGILSGHIGTMYGRISNLAVEQNVFIDYTQVNEIFDVLNASLDELKAMSNTSTTTLDEVIQSGLEYLEMHKEVNKQYIDFLKSNFELDEQYIKELENELQRFIEDNTQYLEEFIV